MDILQTSRVEAQDPEIYAAIAGEELRQRENLELIASENYASRAVREAMACVMTNKYAEGYPGKRYYGGCEWVDLAEILALERLKQIFGADHANVQPHSGAQANMAVFMTALQPGDTVLGMSLAHGGHLTHGTKVSFSGKLYNAVAYGVKRDTELIDFDEVRALALEHRPKLIVAGASAYPRIMEYEPFREIADEVGAALLVDMAHVAGLVAAGFASVAGCACRFRYVDDAQDAARSARRLRSLHREVGERRSTRAVFPGIQGGPLMHTIAAKAVAFGEALRPEFREYQRQVVENARAMAEEFSRAGLRLVAGGTDTHLMLVDVSVKGLTGKAVEAYLDEDRHHRQQERDSIRSAEADGGKRHTHRHAGDHVARHGRRRLPRSRAHYLRRFRRHRGARTNRAAARTRPRADLALRRSLEACENKRAPGLG